ncbi:MULTISPECIES: cell envelope integrity EipB family protein [Rhodomicrobium]|uniref:cell envelope integrity EipB family protein n=1 Tax=Rhodomicrobium TaxID=1068 RepID=UPI00148298D2|nr:MULTISPECIES: cell envelope integrity EipB family protein [Rhodomicrobium]
MNRHVLRALVLALAIFPAARIAEALPQGAAIDLVPHRAIYDMTLKKAVAGSNVSEIRGRLVFDFAGSACDGYSLKSRLVTELIDREGNATVTDLRSTTWEQADGGKFRFNSAQYVDQRLSERLEGSAARRKANEAIDVTIDKPQRQALNFRGTPLFPTQHSLAILEAAQQGTNMVQADIYDGSEKGNKLLSTTTVIGRPSLPGPRAHPAGMKNFERLDELVSWPVSISYYETPAEANRDEGLPTYELSFRLFANGVSRDLLIDYGNFSIHGELSRIDFYPPAACPGPAAVKKK